jgi:hypothetical protein
LCKEYSKGLKTRNGKVRGQEEIDVPGQAERGNSPFLYIFILFRLSTA